MQITSPTEVNPHIEKLLDRLDVEFEPELVPVTPAIFARENSCYYNVLEQVRQSGGKIHYGWVIWQTDLLCEAEHHAVWEDANGDLLCITPRQMQMSSIMFVSDNSRPFNGTSYDNVRVNISGNPIIYDFITLHQLNTKLWALGTRNGEMEVVLPKYVSDQINRNSQILHNIHLYHQNGGRLDTPCFCQSNKKYRHCHGNNLSANAIREFDSVIKHHNQINGKG